MSSRTNNPPNGAKSQTRKTATHKGKESRKDTGNHKPTPASTSTSSRQRQRHQRTVPESSQSSRTLGAETATLTSFAPPSFPEESSNDKHQSSILSNVASAVSGFVRCNEPCGQQINDKKRRTSTAAVGGGGPGSAKSGDERDPVKKLKDIQAKDAAAAASLKESSPHDGPRTQRSSLGGKPRLRVPQTRFGADSKRTAEVTEKFIEAKKDANLEKFWKMFKEDPVLKDKKIVCHRVDKHKFEARVINNAPETYIYLPEMAPDNMKEDIHTIDEESAPIATGHGTTDVEAILNLRNGVKKYIAENEEYVAKNKRFFENLTFASK